MGQTLETPHKQAFIRAKVLENQYAPAKDKVLWSRHAVSKLVVEGLDRAHVETALQTCKVIEDYPVGGRPLPDCLVLGFWQEKPVHAVVAVDGDRDRIFVVTVYMPSLERWEDDWQTRK
jgi:hypothetical protein